MMVHFYSCNRCGRVAIRKSREQTACPINTHGEMIYEGYTEQSLVVSAEASDPLNIERATPKP